MYPFKTPFSQSDRITKIMPVLKILEMYLKILIFTLLFLLRRIIRNSLIDYISHEILIGRLNLV